MAKRIFKKSELSELDMVIEHIRESIKLRFNDYPGGYVGIEMVQPDPYVNDIKIEPDSIDAELNSSCIPMRRFHPTEYIISIY